MNAYHQLRYLPRTARLIWRAARRWTIAWSALIFVQGLLPVVVVWLTQRLVDRLVLAAQARGDWAEMRPALMLMGIFVGALLLNEVLNSLSVFVRTAQAEFVQDHISALVHNKSAAVDLPFYESAEYHDHLHRARDDARTRPLALLESIGGVVQNGITVVALALVLLPYNVWLPLTLLASTLPAVWVVLRYDWRYHQWWQSATGDRRRAWYYEALLMSSEAAAELRLFDLGGLFQAAFQRQRRKLRGEHLSLIKSQSWARLAASLATLCIGGATVAWMGWRTLQGALTIGELVLFYQAFNRSQNLIRLLLADAGKIYSNSLFLGNLFAFLDLQSTVVDPPLPLAAPATLKQGVIFHDVTFRYPRSNRLALHKFNLELPAGRTVAIVGSNGAGKSTLIKLLCRFYDPEVGSITVDGIDLRHLAQADVRRLSTVLFQFPVRYEATASDNIGFGDHAQLPQRTAIEAAARSAGAHDLIMRLSLDYEAVLGKTFAEGTELSGGEWQRMALARAFLRRAPLILLDEPTSAMDAWSEADWFARLRRLAQNSSTLIITHRLTIAMRADIIHVMDQGHIVESGTHAELLARGERYAAAWYAQAQADATLAAPQARCDAAFQGEPHKHGSIDPNILRSAC